MEEISISVWEKQNDENDFEYKLRLCRAKLSKEADLDWQEIVDLTGENIHYENMRRKASGIAEYDDYIHSSHYLSKFNPKSVVTDIDLKKEELQKERYKLQATKIESNRYNRQDSRFELFYENIREAIVRLETPALKIVNAVGSNSKEYVLGMGDFHFGAKFTSQNNEYSRDIFKERLELLLSVLSEEIYEKNISNLKIINVADSIQGILRLTDLQLNEIPVVECVVEVSRMIASFLNELSAYCTIEYYHCPCANHSQLRPLGSKASELASEDMEKIISNYVSDLLVDNSRVTVYLEMNRDYITFNIFDFKAIVMHGHQIKSVPNAIKDISNLHRVLYDYMFLGHRHASNEIIVGEAENHNVEVLTCPSLVGSDPYADKLMKGSKAMAKLYEFDSVCGHTGSKNIILN